MCSAHVVDYRHSWRHMATAERIVNCSPAQSNSMYGRTWSDQLYGNCAITTLALHVGTIHAFHWLDWSDLARSRSKSKGLRSRRSNPVKTIPRLQCWGRGLRLERRTSKSQGTTGQEATRQMYKLLGHPTTCDLVDSIIISPYIQASLTTC